MTVPSLIRVNGSIRRSAVLLGTLVIFLSSCPKASPLSGQSVQSPPSDKSARRQLQIERIERGLKQYATIATAIRQDPAKYKNYLQHLRMDAVADCITMDRIGQPSDGGKWVCNGFKIARPCVVYGIGAGDDISYEEAMAQIYGCEVHVFDPSPRSVRIFKEFEKGKSFGRGSVTYHPWGLGPVSDDPQKARELVIDGKSCQVKTLGEIVAELGHKRIDIFKMDIEGGEWPVFADLFKHSLLEHLGIQQLQIEIHIDGPEQLKRLVDLIDTLQKKDYLLFRKELNPINAECCAEYAWAKRNFILDLDSQQAAK